MAEKTLKTVIKQRFDTLANWQKIWADFVPLRGEVCVFEVPTGTASQPVNGSVSVPQHITKTGDGSTTLQNLPWDSALAADVYAWAKAATKPTYTKSEVGLGNVTNESKATMFTSPAFTGTPTAPTATAGTNTTQVATTAFVTTAVSNLASSTKVNSAAKADEATKVTNSLTLKSGSTNLEVFNGSAAGSVEFVAGSNVTLTPADGKLTIAATDTVYSLPSAGTSLGGIKSGGVATISGGQITAISKAASADNATTANKVANSLTIQGNGTTAGTFNGSATETVNIKGAGSTTVTGADGVITITGATIPTTLKNPNKLTVGSKTYDGSSAVTVSAADLGLSNALHFIGEVDTLPSSGTNGDVVLLGSKEYVYSDGEWVELGDGSSHALKTITISAGSGLTGGGDLSANRTLSHADTSSVANVTANGRTYVTGLTFDGFGHVTAVTTGTETVTNTDTGATSVTVTGTGNAVTTASYDASTRKLTLTKGATYNNYTHPAGNAASKSSGLYKFSTDATSHINAVTAVTKSDITALGIPSSDTTYSAATDGGLSLSGTAFSIDTDMVFVLDGGSATSAW